jgi:GTP:adenosylcobinamide-phosphate guanylyltransferase
LNQSTALTALVLAGSRPGGDPLADYAQVTHKALIEVGGLCMLQRVVNALSAVPQVQRIVVVIEKPEIFAQLAAKGRPLELLAAAEGPSASVAKALAAYGTPLLVTTADHALLQAGWVIEFLSQIPADIDAALAVAKREAVVAAAPHSQRTWLRFSDGQFSGCNLFLLQSARALRLVRTWQEMEAQRKRPLSLLRKLGLSYVLRYALGWLSLRSALLRLGALSDEANVSAIVLRDGRAAIDVDKPADLDLVRSLIKEI